MTKYFKASSTCWTQILEVTQYFGNIYLPACSDIQERSQTAHIAFNAILKVQTFLASHPMYQFIKRFFVAETFHICSAWFYGFWGHENIGMGLRPSITVKGSKHINKVSHRERARVLKPKWNTQKKTAISCGSSVRN